MPFNIDGARKKGVEESKITDYLADKYPNYNIEKARLAGKTDRDINNYLSNYQGWETEIDPIEADVSTDPIERGDEPATWAESIRTGIRNIPKDIVGIGKDLLDAVSHPLNTLETIARIGRGFSYLTTGEHGVYHPDEEIANKVISELKDRYGSEEGFKTAVSEHPAETLMDISSILVPIGKAVSSVPVIGKVGKKVAEVGALAEPTGFMYELGKKVAKDVSKNVIPGNYPSELWARGAQLNEKLSKGDRIAVANTALNDRIIPNMKGMDKIHDKINNLNSQIDSRIEEVARSGDILDVDDLIDGLDELWEGDFFLSGKPLDARRAIEEVKNQISDSVNEVKGGSLTPQDVQKLKKKIYKDLSTYYGGILDSPASQTAQMVVARNAMNFLNKLDPAIKSLNKKEGAYIELRNAIEHEARSLQNKHLAAGLSSKPAYMGRLLGGQTGMLSGLTLGLLDSNNVKTRLAILYHRMQNIGIKGVKPNQALVRLGILQPGRVTEEDLGWSKDYGWQNEPMKEPEE
jgi:hypothetical protein